MKIKFLLLISIFFLTINHFNGLFGANAEEETPSETPIANLPTAATEKKDDSPGAITPQSATPLKWPETSRVSEEDKKLLESNKSKTTQFFTLAQEACKDMVKILGELDIQRDKANKEYRATVLDIAPLLQRIGAAQAENKNP